MSPKLDVSDALEYGLDRVLTRGGATLLAVYVVLQLLNQVGFQSAFAGLFAGLMPPGRMAETYPLAVGLPVAASVLVTVLVLLASFVFTVVALRALYADIDDVPTAEHTRQLGRTVAVNVAVTIVVFLAIMVGFVLFVIPGIFLAVSLAFAQTAVVIEDAGVVEALRRSWSLTSGNRIRLFALGLLVVVAGVLLGFVGSAIGFVSPALGSVLSNVFSSVLSFYGLGVLVGAYRQLAEAESSGAESVAT